MSSEEAERWGDFVLCLEMILFSLLLATAFGTAPYELSDLPLFSGGPGTLGSAAPGAVAGGGAGGVLTGGGRKQLLENTKNAFTVRDIVQDTYHNFMPAYQDYVIQREDEEDGSGAPGGKKKKKQEQQRQQGHAPITVRRRTFIIGNIELPQVYA